MSDDDEPGARPASVNGDAAQAGEDTPAVSAIIMLDRPDWPSNDAFIASLTARIPDIDAPNPETDPNNLVFMWHGHFHAVMRLEVPFPIAAEDSCVRGSWWWPNAWDVLRDHKAHILVSTSGGDARERSVIRAELVAALLEHSTTLGVHWPSADALWQPDHVLQSVRESPHTVPTRVCVSVRLARDGEFKKPDGKPGLLAITWGLAAFGIMEIEVRGYRGEPQSLYAMLLDFADYLINSRAIVADGATIGPDAETKYLVRHEGSTLAEGQQVHRLYLPGSPMPN